MIKLVVSSAAGALLGSVLSCFIPTKGPAKDEPPKPERIAAVDAHAYTEFYDSKLAVSAGAIDRRETLLRLRQDTPGRNIPVSWICLRQTLCLVDQSLAYRSETNAETVLS